MTSVQLTIVDGPQEGSRYEFTAREIHVGRDFSNDLILSHAAVAPRHFKIVDETEEIYLEDLTGEDKTKLNGLFVSREPLHNGDELQAGPYVFHIALTRNVLKDGEDPGIKLVGAAVGNDPLYKRPPALILLTLLLIVGVYAGIYLLTQEGEGKDLSGLGPVPLPVDGIYGYKVGGKTYLDKVEFSFVVQRPKYRLQYRPGFIDKDAPVQVLINGKKLVKLPVTIERWADEIISMDIPQALLMMGETNNITFDNLENPPGELRWGIRDVSVQEVPLPKCDIEIAQKYFLLGGEKYEERRINDANLHDAIQYLKEGLEYVIACENSQMRNVLMDAVGRYEEELQELYDAYIFNVKKFLKLRDVEGAKFELEQILRQIPDESDRRHRNAKDLLEKVNKTIKP